MFPSKVLSVKRSAEKEVARSPAIFLLTVLYSQVVITMTTEVAFRPRSRRSQLQWHPTKQRPEWVNWCTGVTVKVEGFFIASHIPIFCQANQIWITVRLLLRLVLSLQGVETEES